MCGTDYVEKRAYFLGEATGSGEYALVGTCYSSDHREALGMFERGKCGNPVEPGRRYRMYAERGGAFQPIASFAVTC